MLSLALSSLRSRTSSFVATFVNVFLGAAVLMAFASLLDTAQTSGIVDDDASSLRTIAWVVGGWGVLIIVFGVAATLNLSVRQRQHEMALLKAVGATPGQVGRLIVGETLIVAVVAAVLAIPAGFVLGRVLVHQLVKHQVVGSNVESRFGLMALGIGLTYPVGAALLSALYGARKAGRQSVRTALTSAKLDQPRLGRKRVAAGVVFLIIGINTAVLAATVFQNSNYTSEALAGEACIWTALGFAVLSPALIRLGERVVGPLLRPFTGVSGYLAGLNLSQRSSDTAGMLTPVVLFIGLTGGSLGLQQIQNHALAAGHQVQSASDKGVETINFVVVGMLAVFAAVVLINITVSTTLNRRPEFGLQRVVGSTRGQVMRMVSAETLVVVLTGLVFGFVAALVGNVGYSIGVAGTARPHVGAGLVIAVAAVATVITFGAGILSARRALRPSALEAL